MNSGYNPVLFTPAITSRKQMSSNNPEFFFGGSQIPSAMHIPVPHPKIQKGNILKTKGFKR
jgi:hypothetical protein